MSSVVISDASIVADSKNYIDNNFCVSFHGLNFFLAPLPCRCSGVPEATGGTESYGLV